MSLSFEERRARKIARHERQLRRHAARRNRPRTGKPAAPRSNELLPVFYFDQATDEPPCRTDTKTELRTLKLSGEGRFINHGNAFRLSVKSPDRRTICRFRPSRSKDSPASISFAEMRANVGITENPPGEPAIRHVVKRAREKIKAFPGMFDPRAPMVNPRMVSPLAPACGFSLVPAG